MFWNVYAHLCAKAGKAPNVVAREVCGVKSTGTVTGWKNGAVPRNGVLAKLADYFGVTVEELTGEEQKEKPSTAGEMDLSSLSPEDAELVKKILNASEAKKNAIRELL